MDSGKNNNDNEFQQFEVVAAEAKDHHYIMINSSSTTMSSTRSRKLITHTGTEHVNNSSFQNIILKEWKILQENLPDAIYVRAYETRTDLLRAVIIGAPGTPYHDGLFFFDISLPLNYPDAPPNVYYHSHGHRLNPNLYENGYLCLSLVNTWHGTQEEMWTKNSTLLQLLVSIQGLVLKERPYFNEPGYEDYLGSKDAEWVNSSIRYSESAFISSCMTLLHLVKKPPEGFESFVVGHFRARAPAILAAVEGYHGGAVVAGESGEASSSFKTDLEKTRSMIREALDHAPKKKDAARVVKKEPKKRRRTNIS